MRRTSGIHVWMTLACMAWPVLSQSTETASQETVKAPLATAGGGQYSKEYQERARREKIQEDLRQILLVDSVGWIKRNAIRRGDQSLQDMQRERLRRKKGALAEFCQGAALSNLAEVDSLKQLTLAERSTCKDSVMKVNPLIPER